MFREEYVAHRKHCILFFMGLEKVGDTINKNIMWQIFRMYVELEGNFLKLNIVFCSIDI